MMSPPVGLRFCPTNVEIVDYYLRLKNLGGSWTTDVDKVMNTVDICNFDPWELPFQSKKAESEDLVWYFFGVKDNRGERQRRTTSSGGFWKKTGLTMDIMRKRRGNGEKIGEKRVLVFHLSKQSKSEWVMHEYQCQPAMSSNQSQAYTVCKVSFNGEAKYMNPGTEVEPVQSPIPLLMNNYDGSGSEVELSQSPITPMDSYDGSESEVELSQPLIPTMNNYVGFEMDTGFLDLHPLDKTYDGFSYDDWTRAYKSFFGDEQMNLIDLSYGGQPNLGQGNEIGEQKFG